MRGLTSKVKRIARNWVEKLATQTYAGKISTTELVNLIFNFCELYCGRKLYPYQEQFARRIIRSVLENDGEELTALFSRQSGKSETIAVISGGLMIILPTLANMPMFADDRRLKMFKSGFSIGIFAPGERQAKKTYGKIQAHVQSQSAQSIMESPDFNLSFSTSNGQTVALTNGSFSTAISASENSNIEGESFMLIICEECQDISTFKIQKSIHPMGAAYNATIIKIGTATTFKGDFYDTIQRNKDLYEETKAKQNPVRNHFEYDYKIAAKYNSAYAKYVEKEKKRLGENSDAFRMSYKLEWILERGMFIEIEQFERNNLEIYLNRVPYDKSANHVVGIDIGGKGDDTVVTVVEVDWDSPVIMESRINPETGEEEIYQAYNTYIKDWLRISNMPNYEEQYPIIMEYLSRFKISRVVCDATREKSFADRLAANLPYEVIPFIFTTKSKSEAYKFLDREIVSGRAKVCAGEIARTSGEYRDFMQQLADLQKGYSGANLVVQHPSTRNAHDDFPDSWCLAVFASQSKAEVDGSKTVNNIFHNKSDRNEITRTRTINRITARRR